MISVSCVDRRLVLGEGAPKKKSKPLPSARRHGLATSACSYGEFAPALGGSGVSELHNQTMTVTMLDEAG
ncbi:MAG: hypothetical protein IPG91_06730 [Ideonella sp.]|nr:hypothetical protein [Ideonella sp.]